MLELGDIFHLIKTYRLTFGLLLNLWHVFGVSSGEPVLFAYALAEDLKSPALSPWYSVCSQHFIYRLKPEPEEDTAKMSASGLALYLNLTDYSPLRVKIYLGVYFCH